MKTQSELLAMIVEVAARDPAACERMLAAARQPSAVEKVIGRREAAALIGVCGRTVERYAARGFIPEIKLGPRLVRYPLDAVRAFAVNGIANPPAVNL
jgi:hypothetical protein